MAEEKKEEQAAAPVPSPTEKPAAEPQKEDTTGQNQQTQETTSTAATPEKVEKSVEETLKDYFADYLPGGEYLVGKSDAEFLKAIDQQLTGVFGMPYQFSQIVDPVLEETNEDRESGALQTHIGKKFSEKILSVAPIAFFSPGEPAFMSGFTAAGKASMTDKMAKFLALGDVGDEGVCKTDDPSGNKFDEGRYYSFQSNFPQYKLYVNTALRTLARFMKIDELEIPIPGKDTNMKLGRFDIEQMLSINFQKLFGANVIVPFYVDAITEISDSFSNSTTESMLSQSVNQYSQTARELQFLIGSGGTSGGAFKGLTTALEETLSKTTSVLGETMQALGGNNMISQITGSLGTVIAGGKIIFPEIWSESSYSRSYSIDIKLRSPDPDPVSIFLNIYVPIVLLMSMAAPRQLGYSSNSHTSPFLVRVTYKSFFNCDMGMIESLSINRGGENCWNVLGQPTSADISVSLKDLYSSMSISKKIAILSNTAQLDYLANLASIDFQDDEKWRMIKLATGLVEDTYKDIFRNVWGWTKSKLNITANKVLGLIGGRGNF